MSTLSFLVGVPGGEPVYATEGAEVIASANDWVPLGWFALFETGDVRMVSATGAQDGTLCCPTLFTRKDLALSRFQRRLSVYSEAISTDLLGAFRTDPRKGCCQILQRLLAGNPYGYGCLPV